MAIELNVVNKFSNGYLQIDVKNQSNSDAKHYLVHQSFADKFQKDIKEHHKKMNVISNTAIGASAFFGILGADYFTRRFKSSFARYGTNAIAALALIAISGQLVSSYAQNEHSKILNENKAKNINVYT